MSNRSLACALLVLLAGCDVPRVGEFGDACTNGQDDDNDGLIDCADPDCLGAEACREGGMIKVAPHPDAGSSAPDAGEPPFDAGADAGNGHRDAGLDSGVVSRPDASSIAIDEDGGAAMCNPPCAADEACVADATSVHCQPVAAKQAGMYRLRVVSARVPDVGLVGCNDNSCLGFVCVGHCMVDPYVRVVLVRGSVETDITRTSAVIDADMPIFSEAAVAITLMTGDVLRFEAWEANNFPETGGRPIFQCKPDLTQISGQLSCMDWIFPGGAITAELL